MAEDLSSLRVPGFCPICDQPMKGTKSTACYYDWGTCFFCFIEFIEDREQRWKDGWRPSPEEIQAKR